MILGKSLRDHTADSPFRRSTLDDLFRRAVERHGDAVALIDPFDRSSITHGAPKRLTYAEADRAVAAIAARLLDLGLKTDAIIALQLPNTVESVLTLLGVLRAGMIAAPLPLLWRQIEAVDALSRIGARALITCSCIGPVDHGELAMHIAAETFTIRFLCAFGEQHLDGVVALDDVFATATSAPVANERPGNPGDHVAVVTFDIAPDGLVPVARNHAELIAGGLAVVLESRIGHDNAILGTLTTSSFACLSTMVVPWLLSGGTLALHQPFNGAVLAAQCRDRGDVVVLPGPLVARMTEAGLIGGRAGPRTVLSVWRAPARVAGSATWPPGQNGLVDVLAFGEIGAGGIRRNADGQPVAVTPGPVVAPQSQGEGLVLVHISRSPAATIALGGAMIPHHPFPPGSSAAAPRLEDRRRWLYRHRLCLPARSHRHPDGQCAAGRDRQRRRLPLRAAGAAAIRHRRGGRLDARGAARRAGRPSAGRRRQRPQLGAPHPHRPGRQSADRRRLPRTPQRPRLGGLTLQREHHPVGRDTGALRVPQPQHVPMGLGVPLPARWTVPRMSDANKRTKGGT